MRRNALGRVAGCLMGDVFSLKSFVGFVQALIDSLVRATMFSMSSSSCAMCLVMDRPFPSLPCLA